MPNPKDFLRTDMAFSFLCDSSLYSIMINFFEAEKFA